MAKFISLNKIKILILEKERIFVKSLNYMMTY